MRAAPISTCLFSLPKGGAAWTPGGCLRRPQPQRAEPLLFYGPDQAVWAFYTPSWTASRKDNMQYTSVVRCQKSYDVGRTGSTSTLFPRGGHRLAAAHPVLSNGRGLRQLARTDSRRLSATATAFRVSDDRPKLADGDDAGQTAQVHDQVGWD